MHIPIIHIYMHIQFLLSDPSHLYPYFHFLLTCFFQFWSLLELNLNSLFDCYLYMHLQYLENPVMSEVKFVLIF